MPLVGVTVKVMPEGVDVDLEALKKKGEAAVSEIYGEVKEIRVVEEPVAFGLRALKFTFIVDETKGSDVIQEKFASFDEVASAQVVDFRRLT